MTPPNFYFMRLPSLLAAADLVPPNGAPFALDRSGVTVTVISDTRAVEIQGCPAP